MKFYLYFMAVFTALEIPSLFTGQILDLLECVFSIITIVALYGYVYQRKFFSVQFWKRFFILSLITDVVYVSLQIYADLRQPQESLIEILLPFMIGVVLAVPGYIGLYRYTFQMMMDK